MKEIRAICSWRSGWCSRKTKCPYRWSNAVNCRSFIVTHPVTHENYRQFQESIRESTVARMI